MQCNYLSLQILFCIAVLFTSCEVPIEMEGDTQLVVLSDFSDNQDLIVFVTESNLRSSGKNPIVENATVSLFSGENFEFINSLVFVSDAEEPYYKTINFTPEIEVLYMLSVEVPGYRPVTAFTSIPRSVDIAIIPDNTVNDDGLGIYEIEFDLSVSIKDPVESENFYHLLFTQELISYSIGSDGQKVPDTTYLNSDEELLIECTTKTIEIQQLFNYPSFILSDKDFNGEDVILKFAGRYSYDEDIFDRSEFTIEMRTVSMDYYQHFLNLLNKPNSYPLGFDYTFSNVNNGAGFFAGYTSRVNRFKLPN